MVVLVRASTASGQIVGQYQDSSGTHGFLCGGGANGSYTVIDPPGSVGTEPTSINASGQIADWYVGSSNYPVHGFLATANPVEHWVNTAGGNWSTAANWNPGVPTAAFNADIDATGTYSVAITTAAIAYGLLVNDAQATVTDNKSSLTLFGSGGTNGALIVKAGTLSSTAVLLTLAPFSSTAAARCK